jgi:hypothetical protein
VKLWVPVVAVIVSLPTPARAEVQAWEAITLMGRLDKEGSGPAGWLSLDLRRRGNSTQYLVRPALGWAFSSKLVVHGGYGWIPTDPDDGAYTSEHRIWEQVIYNGAVNPDLKYQGRARLEQRFGPNSGVGHRLRMLGRIQWQFSHRTPLQLVAWDELFVGFNQTDDFKLKGFDQNRAFAGIGAETSVKGMRVDAGYMLLVSQGGDKTDHIVGFFVLLNTWLRAPKPAVKLE